VCLYSILTRSVNNVKSVAKRKKLCFRFKDTLGLFTGKSLTLVEKSFREVAEKMNFQILEFNGESDHVHALIEYPPKLSISVMVNSLKGVSSRRHGQAGYPKPYGKDALWSPSYFVSSVGGAPLEVLKSYIKDQEKPS